MASTPPPPPAPLDDRGLPLGWNFRPDWEVTPRQTRDLLAAPEVERPLLLDCREPDEFDFARIEGGVLVPLGQVEQRADDIELAAGDRSRPIIVYCHHGRRSLRAATTLRALGFTDVKSMAGGIDVWSVDIDPAVRRY